jgi:elongator complex protein 1
VLVSARRSAQALVAYERALDWRAAHALAISNEVPKDERNAMGYRMAEELSSKKRHTEAADALLALCGDVRAAAIAYVEGGMVSEARRVVSAAFRAFLTYSLRNLRF